MARGVVGAGERVAVAQDDSSEGTLGSAAPVAAADLKKILLVVPVFHAVYPRPFTRFLEMAVVAGRQLGYVFAIHTPNGKGS